MKISEFISNWNKTHTKVIFASCEAPENGRLVSVEVRFPTSEITSSGDVHEKWCCFSGPAGFKSHGTMYVVTNEELFSRGIVEFKVASLSHKYREEFVIDTLIWIGEVFFSDKSRNN